VTDTLLWLVRRHRYRAIRSLWTAWQTGLDAVAANPRMYSPAENAPPGIEVRYYFLPRTSYRIVYVVLPTETVVLALAHGRRGTDPWLSRLPQVLTP
jgi:plasmid stabilization system protein ParE